MELPKTGFVGMYLRVEDETEENADHEILTGFPKP